MGIKLEGLEFVSATEVHHVHRIAYWDTSQTLLNWFILEEYELNLECDWFKGALSK